MNPFYPFLLNLWMMDQITEETLRSFVPFYISEDELNMILVTPKLEDYEAGGGFSATAES